MENIALKRHPSLKPLSRDHGVGLVFAQRLTKAVCASKHDRVRLAEQMRSTCTDIILSYIEDEQRILSPVILDAKLRQKFQGHHGKVRKMTGRLEHLQPSDDPSLGLLSRISDALDDYVRWEERVLFPALEEELSPDQLQKLSVETTSVESKRTRPTQQLHSSIALDKQSGEAETCGCSISTRE